MVRNQIENVTFSFKNLSKITPETQARLQDFKKTEECAIDSKKWALRKQMRNDFCRKGLSQFTNII